MNDIIYKTYRISLEGNNWSVYDKDGNSLNFNHESLSKTKEKIDRLEREEKAMKPILAILHLYREAEIVTITSISEDRREVWYRDQNKNRHKADLHNLYQHSQKNLKLMEAAKQLMEESEKKLKESRNLLSTLDPIKLK